MEETNAEIKLDRLGQTLTVEDLSRATTFYRDKLGMTFLFEVPDMAFFACGEARLMLTLPEAERVSVGANSILFFR